MVKYSLIILLVMLLLCPFNAFGQSDSEAADDTESQEPEPYSDEEFPPWLRKIRRGEVILIGSIPITMLVSNLSVQLYWYAAKDFEEAYSPSIFGGNSQSAYTDDEKKMILRNTFITAISLSAAIALSDFIIGEILEKRDEGKKR